MFAQFFLEVTYIIQYNKLYFVVGQKKQNKLNQVPQSFSSFLTRFMPLNYSYSGAKVIKSEVLTRLGH